MPPNQTLTRAEIATAIRARTGMSQRRALLFVDDIIDAMLAALEAGENVKILKFGKFIVSEKAGRLGRNPKTGSLHEVVARRIVLFHASETLRARVAHPL